MWEAYMAKKSKAKKPHGTKGAAPKVILRFTRRSAEFLEIKDISKLKKRLRGIYVLYQASPKPNRGKRRYDVCYIGMATKGGMKGRLQAHKRSKRKTGGWTHFSVFQVWDNITNQEIAELEGFSRHIYRRDSASTFNIQRGHRPLSSIENKNISGWD
jgi:hypothetical protein